MVRRIIEINEEKCNGCGACAKACHEGAIAIVNGKAKLMRDDYCDGLGDCLPACPTNAISFVEREAAAYDEAAVLANKAKKDQKEKLPPKYDQVFETNIGEMAFASHYAMMFDQHNVIDYSVDKYGFYLKSEAGILSMQLNIDFVG